MSVLYINGVLFQDIAHTNVCVDELFDNMTEAFGYSHEQAIISFESVFNSKESTMDLESKDIEYGTLFTDLDSNNILQWHENTNLWCWYCHLPINGKRYAVPHKMEVIPDKDDEIIFLTQGVYCGPSCVKSTINCISKLSDRHECESLFSPFTIKLNGYAIDINKVRPSPPPTSRTRYGGQYSETEYRDYIQKLNRKN